MTKRTQHIESELSVDASAEFEALQQPDEPELAGIVAPGVAPLHNLTISGIVTVKDGVVTWRDGHLEHIAKLYVADPTRTERDYLDDLIVARNLDAEHFAALVDKARGS